MRSSSCGAHLGQGAGAALHTELGLAGLLLVTPHRSDGVSNPVRAGDSLVSRSSDAGGDLFGDDVVSAAMIDWPVHHAEVMALKDDRYRLKDRDLGAPHHWTDRLLKINKSERANTTGGERGSIRAALAPPRPPRVAIDWDVGVERRQASTHEGIAVLGRTHTMCSRSETLVRVLGSDLVAASCYHDPQSGDRHLVRHDI